MFIVFFWLQWVLLTSLGSLLVLTLQCMSLSHAVPKYRENVYLFWLLLGKWREDLKIRKQFRRQLPTGRMRRQITALFSFSFSTLTVTDTQLASNNLQERA